MTKLGRLAVLGLLIGCAGTGIALAQAPASGPEASCAARGLAPLSPAYADCVQQATAGQPTSGTRVEEFEFGRFKEVMSTSGSVCFSNGYSPDGPTHNPLHQGTCI